MVISCLNHSARAHSTYVSVLGWPEADSVVNSSSNPTSPCFNFNANGHFSTIVFSALIFNVFSEATREKLNTLQYLSSTSISTHYASLEVYHTYSLNSDSLSRTRCIATTFIASKTAGFLGI